MAITTYAATAARVSNGFARVVEERSARNTKMNAVITASLYNVFCNEFRIHIGPMSITDPTPTMRVEMNLSIRLSEVYVIVSLS